MTKRMIWMWAAVAALWLGPAVAPAVAQQEAVLLLVPARFSVMQVAFDVARRYPTVLVSYQGTPEEPVLHVWNGYEWMPLSLTDYQSGAFLQTHPGRTFFLGDDALLPPSLRSISAWCADVTQIPNLETPALVNMIGRHLPFTPGDWRWFAGRYNLTLTNLRAEEAEAARRQSWYDGAGPVRDPAPGFFRYFSRPRRSQTWSTQPRLEPVQVHPDDVVEMPAP